ncbi:hypothetical protein HYDPIDRAFT_187767 [Hydnomerulius pinastri MD-312]|uniref:Uncharacterized protein n=1 Tax=Hydnomerulius pinastri MD-312 TaxID=994086 RepID=A0A0C9WAH3_9AGAM|nr:hypothetical protein HYDPIDRAFT_187767 [Hydnomerulius pinastri MD-312]
MANYSRTSQSPYPMPPRLPRKQGSSLKNSSRAATDGMEELIDFLAHARRRNTNLFDRHGLVLTRDYQLSRAAIGQKLKTISWPGLSRTSRWTMPDCGVRAYIEQVEAHLPVNPTTLDDHLKTVSIAFSVANSIMEWLFHQSRKTQNAFYKRHNQIYLAMKNKPPPPPAPKLDVPAETARSLTRQELQSFKNPFEVFGKSFKVDDLVFKVISYTQLPRGGSEFKLWYEIAEDPVEVSEEELHDVLSSPNCLYCPQN